MSYMLFRSTSACTTSQLAQTYQAKWLRCSFAWQYASDIPSWGPQRACILRLSVCYADAIGRPSMQAALSLYLYLGKSILLQLESFLWKLLLPLAEGKGAHSVGRQEAALEVWLSFVPVPQSSYLRGRRCLSAFKGQRSRGIQHHVACTSMLLALGAQSVILYGRSHQQI